MKKDIYNSSDVVFLSADMNYTEIYFKTGRKMVSSFTLLRHQEKLENFIRVSKKHLVNPTFIRNYEHTGNKMNVEMKNGKCLKVSRRRIKDVLSTIESLPNHLLSNLKFA